MPNFALITEGVTDQAVIENMLEGVCDAPEVTALQPIRDATDKQTGWSNWELVFDYLSRRKFAAAFQLNDYVIVQIDTDVSDEPNFNIPKKDLSPETLIERVIDKMMGIIRHNHEYHAELLPRTLFAVSVHSLECWILPLHAKADNDKGRILSCHGHLERALKRKVAKDYYTYDALTKGFRKTKNLNEAAVHNASLAVFLNRLKNVYIE